MEPWFGQKVPRAEPNGAAGEDSTALRYMMGRQEGLNNGGRVLIIDLFIRVCWDDRFSPKIHRLSIHMSMIDVRPSSGGFDDSSQITEISKARKSACLRSSIETPKNPIINNRQHQQTPSNKMKLSAVVLLALPLQVLAGTCYFCENTPHVGAVRPTYDCGKKCHKKHYNTDLSTYHCWMDGRNPTCFKNCCKRAGRQVGTIDGL
ncbi:hypothetical protein TMEN_9558 [Trichophyton mentagrophytes]|nr:hypothetical protein TMEN_9558 [Trichophyton mentagrophytes]